MVLYTIESSMILRVSLLGAHLLALGTLFAADMTWPWQVAICMFLVASGLHTLRNQGALYLRCDPGQGQHIYLSEAGQWQETTRVPGSVVLPYIVVLRVRMAHGKKSRIILILPDCIGKEEFRRLRMCLRRQATR